MKRTTKKLMTMIMALAFVFTFAMPVKAANNGSITINNTPANSGVTMVGTEYKAYKVFNMVKVEQGGKTTYSYTVEKEFENFFKGLPGYSADKNLDKFAIDYVNNTKIEDVSKAINAYVLANSIVAKGSSNNVVVNGGLETVIISNLEEGYYIVIGNAKNATDNSEIVALAALQNAGNANVTLKASAPTIDKQIKHNENNTWGVVGDNQIGDKVEYRLISSVPGVVGYDTYIYKIYDRMTSGLTLNRDSIEVYVGEKENGGTLLASSYYTVNIQNNQEFTVDVDIIKGINEGAFTKGDKLYIYFNATLNENALIAPNSNDNEAKLQYSNNPNDGSVSIETPWVDVKDYTFQLNINKTDKDGNPLKGVEFELHRNGNAISFKNTANGYVVCTNTTHTDECTSTLVTNAEGKIAIIGLDDAVEYSLIETKALPGYNSIDPIKFTITANYNGKTLNNLRVNNDTISVSEFKLGTTIINTTGSGLPETGGIGTTLFTVVGGILMVSAAAGYFFLKKKEAN